MKVKFDVLFDGIDMADFADKLREVNMDEIEFSNEPEFMKDVQLIIDENYLNEVFLQLFHSQKRFSLKEILISLLDTQSVFLLNAGKMAINSLMTSAVWSKWLPTIH